MRGQTELLWIGFLGENKRRELRLPVVALRVEFTGEIEQAGVSRPVVEPQYAHHFVGPPEDGPLFEWLRFHGAQLVREIAPHKRNHALVSGALLILCERLQHDHIWPPVAVLLWPDESVGTLMREGPIHPPSGFVDQPPVLEQIFQRNQAIQEVRSAL